MGIYVPQGVGNAALGDVLLSVDALVAEPVFLATLDRGISHPRRVSHWLMATTDSIDHAGV